MCEDRKYRYLELLQGIISRMAECSFKCKEFCILVVSALLAVFATNIYSNFYILFACLVPTIVFWSLDTYYLTQERSFRKLYRLKASLAENSSDFEDFNFNKEKSYIKDYLKVFWSKTIWPLYLTLFLLLVAGAIVFLINHYHCFIPMLGDQGSSSSQ